MRLSANVSENPVRLSQRAAKNSLVVLVGQALTLLANLGVTVLLARYCGKESFGLFSYALVYVGFFAILMDFGMQAILIREISSPRWPLPEILGNALLIKAALSFIVIVLMVATAWVVGYSGQLFCIIAILALNLLSTSKLATIRNVFEAPFSASLQMELPVLLQCLDSLILVGGIYALTQSHAGLEALVLGYSFSNFPGLMAIVVIAKRRFKFRWSINRELVRFLGRESLPLLLYSILMALFNSADVLFLREFRGESAVGVYSAASRLTSPLLFIPQVIVASLFPLLSRYQNESETKSARAFHLGMKLILLPALALAIVTTFLAPDVIHLLYSQEYLAAIAPLLILMWSQVFLILIFFFANVLTSMKQQRAIFYTAVIMLATNVVGNWLMIPAHGVSGAATAKLVSAFCGFAVLLVPICKSFSLPIRELLPKLAMLGGLFATAVVLTHQLSFALALVAAIVIFPPLIWISGIFNAEERNLLRTFFPTPIGRER